MKNAIKVFLIVTLLLIIGCNRGVSASPSGAEATETSSGAAEAALNGTWEENGTLLGDFVFNNGNYERLNRLHNTPTDKGTYKVNGQQLIITKTHNFTRATGEWENSRSNLLPAEITGDNTFVFAGVTFTRKQ